MVKIAKKFEESFLKKKEKWTGVRCSRFSNRNLEKMSKLMLDWLSIWQNTIRLNNCCFRVAIPELFSKNNLKVEKTESKIFWVFPLKDLLLQVSMMPKGCTMIWTILKSLPSPFSCCQTKDLTWRGIMRSCSPPNQNPPFPGPLSCVHCACVSWNMLGCWKICNNCLQHHQTPCLCRPNETF